MKILIKIILSALFLLSPSLAQYDFDLEDLNPASDSYGQMIGPSDYVGDICIIFFGHEY